MSIHRNRALVTLWFAFVSGIASAADSLDELEPLPAIALRADTRHVQGIEVDGSTLWVSAVDSQNKTGWLFEFSLPDGALRRSVEVRDGPRYHAGGISGDTASLWIPVAEYTRESTSVIQRRNKRTLAVEAQFPVKDHIGCVALAGDRLIGGNWDARDLYVWTLEGKLVRKTANPVATAFQDLKFVNGELAGGGLLPDRYGAIDWLSFPGLEPLRRMTARKTDRGVAYTHEGMAIAGDKLYLLPEDQPSRLFIFRYRRRQ